MNSSTKMLLAASLMVVFQACSGVKPPRTLHYIVREQPAEVVNGTATFEVMDEHDQVYLEGKTNQFGYFRFKSRKLAERTQRTPADIGNLGIKVNYQGQTAHISINPFNPVQDIYLTSPAVVEHEDQRVADMHYHISMRTHNSWGYQFYGIKELRRQVPANLNWNRLYKDICVYRNGKWKSAPLSKSLTDSSRRLRMKLLLEGEWVKSTHGANSLKKYSQATPPHLLEGNVYLAYNAISPFEHSISNEGIKRLISSSFKSGANIKWLKTMGGKKGQNFITHWNNFNREYRMITEQDTAFNNFQWSYLRRRDKIDQKTGVLSKPLVVNVVEGGHVLQDKYFPHFVNFNMAKDTLFKLALFETIFRIADRSTRSSVAESRGYQNLSRAAPLSVEKKIRFKYLKRQSDSVKRRKIALVDSVLVKELQDNIDSLKRLDVFMMAISHLSYNGMTGHSPALDVSKKPFFEKIVSAIVKRAYGNRVSEDRRYRKSFDGLFFSVPGVNQFGDSVINRLLDPEGGRIHIDLKHSDVLTRKFILDKYQDLDSLPPICSHCGVNGMPIDYNSPFTNEYRLLESSLARKFYPFGINLYNEEVERIVASDGIIGIPLEERVLGGYLDNKIRWPVTIKVDNDAIQVESKTTWKKKRKYMLDAVYVASKQWKDSFDIITNYYRDRLSESGVTASDKEVFELICEEYFSAESFLNNLFHIVDISRKVSGEEIIRTRSRAMTARLDSLLIQDPDRDRKRTWMVQQELDKMKPEEYASSKKSVWKSVCIGSDLDGLIDPINICPTASQYPIFKQKLELFIPLFLYVRDRFEREDPVLGPYSKMEAYFDSEFTPKHALDMLFYHNLKDFTIKAFNHD